MHGVSMEERPPKETKLVVNVWRCDVCQERTFETLEEATEHENECLRLKEQQKTNNVHPFFQRTAPTKKKSKPKQQQEIDLVEASHPKRRTVKKPHVEKNKKPRKNEEEINFASFFTGVDPKTLLAEQAAAELRAKRLLQQQRQRDKAARKQQTSRTVLQPKLQHFKATTSEARAPRFPVPSHVGAKPAEPVVISIPATWAASGQTQVPSTCTREYPLFATSGIFHNESICDKDPLQSLLTATLRYGPQGARPRSSQPWADSYGIGQEPVDLLRESLLPIFQAMKVFIEQWMTERSRAEERAAERQRKLAKTKIRKKQRSNHDDDDLWDDDDESLQSAFLLTGPVGAGKTQLVHAVAKLCGCNVLEMNTSEKRGAAALRRMLEEATQSHSSLDMLKKQNAANFGMLEYSDEDDGQSTLTVVLIDEADNLFEEHGDAGFWTALNDLTRKAKCPIFLTANKMPNGRFVHWQVPRPTPQECVAVMRRIIENEGLALATDVSSDDSLSDIAKLCDCDLRRIANELQLFSCLIPVNDERRSPDKSSSVDFLKFEFPRIDNVLPKDVRHDSYSLLTIKGSNFMSLATPPALGNGGYPVQINLGDLFCPHARIMDDSTILAVAPPCFLPSSLTDSRCSTFAAHHRRSYVEEYRNIVISSTTKVGIISTTSGSTSVECMPDGSSMLVLDVPCVVVYHFSTMERKNDHDVEEEEAELHVEIGGQATVQHLTRQSAILIDWREANKVLKQGIDAWDRVVPECAVEKDAGVDVVGESVQQRSWLLAAKASDAAFVEDVGLKVTPFIAGASRGFGFDLTEGCPVSTNDKSKPPLEELHFELGWKDKFCFFGNSDCYVTNPMTARERILLTGSLNIRGLAVELVALNDVSSGDGTDELILMPYPSEEDWLLPRHVPLWLESLPCYLRPSDYSSLRRLVSEALWDKDAVDRQARDLTLLDYVFPGEMDRSGMFALGVGRETLDPLLQLRIDDMLVLDYLPLLRIMAIHDNIYRSVLKEASSMDRHQRRITRRSAAHEPATFLRPCWNDPDGSSGSKVIESLAASSFSIV